MTTMMTHSISNCFEISSAPLSGTGVVIDEEFVKRMRSSYKQTFPDLEAVGWYWCSVENGKEEEEEEKTKKEIHEQIKECVKDAVDCPMVLLTVDAKVRGRDRSPGSALPAKLFRFEETDRTFKAISYAIDASPAERVAADHASKATERTELETKESRVLAYLMERRVGVKALRDRVGTMLEFLEKEVRGENDTEDDRARFIAVDYLEDWEIERGVDGEGMPETSLPAMAAYFVGGEPQAWFTAGATGVLDPDKGWIRKDAAHNWTASALTYRAPAPRDDGDMRYAMRVARLKNSKPCIGLSTRCACLPVK